MPIKKTSIKTFIYTALPCEAKPIVDFYRLKKVLAVHCFAIYSQNDICLTVTGMGKTAMAAGVAYSQALFLGDSTPVMLNVGVAGHSHQALGSIFLADKITDIASGRHYYPPLVVKSPCITLWLQTYDRPQAHYPDLALCDMEGSAFYETATRFATGELVQCLKIISDNTLSPSHNVNPKQVSELISKQLSVITALVQDLKQIADLITHQESPEFNQLLSQYRFSVNEQIQLKKLLSRWRLLTTLDDLSIEDIPANNGKEFLALLDQKLNTAKFDL